MSEAYREFLKFGDCPGDWESNVASPLLTNVDGYQIRTGAVWTLQKSNAREFLAVAYRQDEIDTDVYHFVVMWFGDNLCVNMQILHRKQHNMVGLDAEYGTRADAMDEVVTWMSCEAYDIMQQHPDGYHGGQPPLSEFATEECNE